MVNVVNPNFGETNLCVSSASSSFGLPHTLCSICASSLIYLVVLFLCVPEYRIYLLSLAEVLHQVTFVLELEERGLILFVQVLSKTGLTCLSNRSNRLASLLSGWSVCGSPT